MTGLDRMPDESVCATYLRAAEGNSHAIAEVTNRVDGPLDKPVVEEPLDTTGISLERIQRIVARARARLAAKNAEQGTEPGQLVVGDGASPIAGPNERVSD